MPISRIGGKDALSTALKPVSVLGKVFCFSEFSSPWNASFSFSKRHDAFFHIILKGKCFLIYSNQDAKILHEGDVVIVPRGTAHALNDRHEATPVSFLGLLRNAKGPVPVVRYGGGGQVTKLACGTFEIETGKEVALLRLLPDVMYIPASSLSSTWLKGTIDLLEHEARNYGNGSALIVNGLINLMLVQAIRQWIYHQPKATTSGLLAALQDPRIADVIAAIHSQPQENWNVGSLAKVAGMSRSSLSAYFSSYVGQPPLSYLTNWRMEIAGQLLRTNTRVSLSRVCEEVGYFSQEAFSKAFKRHYGVSPSMFRHRNDSVSSAEKCP